MYADSGMKILEDLNSRNLDIVQSANAAPKAIASAPSTTMPMFSLGAKTVDFTVKGK
jgi:hypothetical protein